VGVVDVEDKKMKRINMLTLAFGIAFMPQIWSVVSPYIVVCTGAVAINKYIFVLSWLCGWAIGLTIMGSMKVAEIGTLPITSFD
jgi:hypothetical protein